jgi:pimeloyl-ACP methyl ester carboxylesterase
VPVQHLTSADGTRISYRVTGHGDPLVMVHGAGTSSADWLVALPQLRERFTVVTMDRRGRGGSGDAPEYSIEREAEDVLALLEAVGGELLLGHSYGALCSILAAQRTNRLRRLVLYEPPIAVREEWVERLEAVVASGEIETGLERFLRGAGMTAEQLEAIRSSRAWPVLLEAAPLVPRELRAASEWRAPSGPVEVKTLFLQGADTTGHAYVDGLDELRAAFPNSRFELIPGQQHVAHVFAPAVFAKLVGDFCAEPAS